MIAIDTYAQMALRVYDALQKDEAGDIINRPKTPVGWRELSWKPDDITGFSYGVYENITTGRQREGRKATGRQREGNGVRSCLLPS